MEYLDLQHFPVLLEDYEGTTDRPECELPSDESLELYHGVSHGAIVHAAVPHAHVNLSQAAITHEALLTSCLIAAMATILLLPAPRGLFLNGTQGHFRDCNVRLKDIGRLEDVVATALYRWAADTGQALN